MTYARGNMTAVWVLAMAASSVLSGIGTETPKPLKELFFSDFLIGGATAYPDRNDSSELDMLVREVNCLTAENGMKWENLQPRPGVFRFDQVDEFVTFAEQNDMIVVGHVLVWHSQVPSWLFTDHAGQPVSREVLISRMRDHIHAVVGRYKGRIKYRDVVNEAVDTRWLVDENAPKDADGNPQKVCEAFMRDSPWQKSIGDDYIEMAFRFAHEADPSAQLLYNDYSMTNPAKAAYVVAMVRRLKAKGVPIHGVGMQGTGIWNTRQWNSCRKIQRNF